MHVRRTILCLAAAFLWTTHDPDMASGHGPDSVYRKSSELWEAYSNYDALYQEFLHSEAEPYAKEALRPGTEEFGPNDPSTVTLLNNLAGLYRV